METIVYVKNLSFSYDKKVVFQDTGFSLEKGEFRLITGVNGSGKSTLFRLLTGLLPVQQGKILLWGKTIKQFRDWHKLGYLSQTATSFNCNFPATVEEVVGLHFLRRRGLFTFLKKEERQRIADVLALVGLEGENKKLLGKLSGGQQQRVFIARALASMPELLLLDEPNAGIDQENAALLAQLLQKINQEEQTTILLIAHNWPALDWLPTLEVTQGKLVLTEKREEKR